MKSKIFGVVICFCVSFLAINYWSQVSFDIAQKEQRSLLQQLTIKHAIQIEQHLTQATASQKWLNFELNRTNSLDVETLVPLAQHIVDSFPEISQIAISPNSVTAITIPHQADAIGNLIISPSSRVNRDSLDGQFYDPPYHINGHSVFVKHVPVMVDKSLWGYVSYSLNLDLIFAKSYLEAINTQSFNYQLVHINKHHKETILIQSKQPLSHKIYLASIRLSNANLLLKLSPTSKTYTSTIIINIILSLSFASIFTLVCYLGLTEPNRLRQRLNRTQDKLTNLQLIQDSIINSISDEVVFSDPNGQVLIHNNKALKNTHIPSNILFSNTHDMTINSLFENDGKTFISPSQHPINRALFNGESVQAQAVIITDEHIAKHIEITSFAVKNDQRVIGVLSTTTELVDSAPSLIGELSRSAVLEMLEQDKSLSEVFEFTIKQTQNMLKHVTVAISLIDQKRHQTRQIREIYSLDLPGFYRHSMIGTAIEERLMSSNSAIHQNKMIIVEDINVHPYWIHDKEMANHAGFRACWSQPLRNISGNVIGSLDFYASDVLTVNPAMVVALKETAHLVELTLERHQDIYRQNRMSLAVQHTSCAVTIVDSKGVIEYINPKYTQVSGYSAHDVIGSTSPLFDTNIVDKSRHQEMNSMLIVGDVWHGQVINTTKSGDNYSSYATVTPIVDTERQISQIVISQENITHEVPNHLAAKPYRKSTDNITGLLTQHAFIKHLDRVLAPKEHQTAVHCLCSINIEQHKGIAQQLGRNAADELLRQVGQLLSQAVRKRDVLARLSSNKFAILLENCHWQPAHKSLSHLVEQIGSYRFQWQQHSFAINLCIGVTEITSQLVNSEVSLQQSDIARLEAKKTEQAIVLYQQQHNDVDITKGDLHWSQQIRHALAQDSFSLFATPIHTINQPTQICHYHMEVSIAIDGGFISSQAFSTAASRYNLSNTIDKWIIERSIDWLRKNMELPPPRLSINLNETTLQDHSFALYLLRLSELEPTVFRLLSFEFSENSYASHTASCQRMIDLLAHSGCQFIINNFGQGFSSFGLLRDASVNAIKVSDDFTDAVLSDPLCHQLAQAIASYASSLNLDVIAVTQVSETIRELARLGFTHTQSRAIEIDDLTTELTANVQWQHQN